jgi:hypothetical protein
MKTPDFRRIDLAISGCWSPEQALAVFELLDNLRDKIWTYCRLRLQQLLAEEQQTTPRRPPRPSRTRRSNPDQ